MEAPGTSSGHETYPECAMLDNLTHQQRYYMFNMVNPAFKSHAGKKMDPSFSWKQKTSPMVYSPEAGLVMYERVVVGPQEAIMLNKLSRPKTTRTPAAPNKPTRAQERLEGAQKPQPGWASSAHVDHTAASSTAAGSSQSQGQGQQSAASEARSTTPGVDGGAGAGAGASSPAPATSLPSTSRHGGSSKYGLSAIKPSKEEEEMLRYVNRERAVMTASHVFTWGGRLKYSGPENGLSRQTWATGLSKPPLRL